MHALFVDQLYAALWGGGEAYGAWSANGKTFVMADVDGLLRDHFGTASRVSFTRQLHYYGFTKKGWAISHKDWHMSHPLNRWREVVVRNPGYARRRQRVFKRLCAPSPVEEAVAMPWNRLEAEQAILDLW